MFLLPAACLLSVIMARHWPAQRLNKFPGTSQMTSGSVGPGAADSHRSHCAGCGFVAVCVCHLLIFHILLEANGEKPRWRHDSRLCGHDLVLNELPTGRRTDRRLHHQQPVTPCDQTDGRKGVCKNHVQFVLLKLKHSGDVTSQLDHGSIKKSSSQKRFQLVRVSPDQ